VDFDDDLGGSGYNYDELYFSADVCNAVDERYGYVGEVSEGLRVSLKKRDKSYSVSLSFGKLFVLFNYPALVILVRYLINKIPQH